LVRPEVLLVTNTLIHGHKDIKLAVRSAKERTVLEALEPRFINSADIETFKSRLR